MRGRRATRSAVRPFPAASAMCGPRSAVPAVISGWPCRKSSPRGRMLAPASRSARIDTCSSPASVSSTRTTLSMPSGTGAPVMMRHAVPRITELGALSPAAIVPDTASTTGNSAVAPRTSAACTA